MPEHFSLKRRKMHRMAERKLEEGLRALEGFGAKFRRQAPKGSEVVDYISDTVRVVIELDIHEEIDERQAQYNAQRIAFLTSRGYQFLRFWTSELLQNHAQVMATIIAVLRLQQAKLEGQASANDDRNDQDPSDTETDQAGTAASDEDRRQTSAHHPGEEGKKRQWL